MGRYRGFTKNRENVDLEQAFTRFKTQLPQHPYSLLNYHDVQLALNGFFTYFPELLAFQKKDTYRNRSVLTSLGKLKTLYRNMEDNFS